MLGYKLLNFFFREHRKNLDVSLCVSIRGVNPVLVKLVRRRLFRVKPYVATFTLAKLSAVSFGNQWAG